jgi:hypothetical protein
VSKCNWPTTGTAREIGRHILDCINRFLEQHPAGNERNWNDLKDRILRWGQELNPDVAFAGLLWILETQTRYQYQLVAGELLDRASLKSPLPLHDLLVRIIPHFEESAKTIPKYLSNSFGRDAVIESLQEMRCRPSTAAIESKVRTMLYWLGERVPG